MPCTTVALPVNIRLENKAFAQYDIASCVTYAHFWSFVSDTDNFVGWTDTETDTHNGACVHLYLLKGK